MYNGIIGRTKFKGDRRNSLNIIVYQAGVWPLQSTKVSSIGPQYFVLIDNTFDPTKHYRLTTTGRLFDRRDPGFACNDVEVSIDAPTNMSQLGIKIIEVAKPTRPVKGLVRFSGHFAR